MLLGYIRITADDEDSARQRRDLHAAGCDLVIQETGGHGRGGSADLARLMTRITAGDMIVVTSLYQLARSTNDLLRVVRQLKECGAELRSLGETWADTTAPSGWMVFTVLSGMAQFERGLGAQRTTTGRMEAKLRGVRFGRPPSLAEEQINQGRELVRQGTSVRRAAALVGCHYASLYRALTLKEGTLKEAAMKEVAMKDGQSSPAL